MTLVVFVVIITGGIAVLARACRAKQPSGRAWHPHCPGNRISLLGLPRSTGAPTTELHCLTPQRRVINTGPVHDGAGTRTK